MFLGFPASERLFDGYEAADLGAPEFRHFVVLRLLEEGDSADLRSLFSQISEEELSALLFPATNGSLGAEARQLSARSRAFWHWILGGSTPIPAEDHPLWPLA